jgi:hypothetical protein
MVQPPFPDDLAARVPGARAGHEALGLTDDESWATLRDVLRTHEVRGEEPFSDVGWNDIVFSGRLAELGRLQFELRPSGTLAIHIPESGPLTPAACDASFARAREVFPEHEVAWCHSWLLDPQLAGVLLGTSNIVRFHRRFELTGESEDGNGDVLRFDIHTSDPNLDKLTPTTTLERAILEHLRAGRSWRVATGVTSLR